METKHLNIRVYGEVQAVLFRRTAQQKAEALGVRGFARNEGGGTVYIEVEGAEEALNRFLKWCENGPPLARVEHIETREGELKKFLNFTVV
jgi:acylphosphatase